MGIFLIIVEVIEEFLVSRSGAVTCDTTNFPISSLQRVNFTNHFVHCQYLPAASLGNRAVAVHSCVSPRNFSQCQHLRGLNNPQSQFLCHLCAAAATSAIFGTFLGESASPFSAVSAASASAVFSAVSALSAASFFSAVSAVSPSAASRAFRQRSRSALCAVTEECQSPVSQYFPILPPQTRSKACQKHATLDSHGPNKRGTKNGTVFWEGLVPYC
ncbi:hypothetical protein B484DRAFT_92972 [Ochromonadaceae sp. CCMP2298]|nr:hypothetical protein B484DRAFT_92972 [Ochromonadaceae sp. CCMP2298]